MAAMLTKSSIQSSRIYGSMYFWRLCNSFDVLISRLEVPQIARRAVLALLIIHSGLLAYSAYVHSPTLNEPGHLVAGLSHWQFGRFELYRVNPPLVRMVAALPVMAVEYEKDWSGFHEGPGARPVFGMGEDFVAANGERSFFLFMITRWACIPFSWIGAITCYLWARDLYGRPAGVMACTLWCFSPNILGHASLITPDAHASALGLAACYTFWRWLKNPTWTQAMLTGVVLGLAELAKTTLILFYPLWPILWLIYRWQNRFNMLRKDWFREAGMLLLRMAIGINVLNLGYGFEGTGEYLNEFHFVSDLFTGNKTAQNTSAEANRKPEKSTNRFANTWIGNIPVPFPKNYLLGIDIQQKDFEDYGQPSYLRGKFQDHGWWYYYLYAVAIKVQLGTWFLAMFTLLAIKRLKSCERSWTDELVLLGPPAIILIVVSSKTGFNHHMRYVLPCFPFLFVWIGQTGLLFRNLSNSDSDSNGLGNPTAYNSRFSKFSSLAAIVALAWSVSSALYVYPHNLSYFNELTGGPRGGANHLLHSNIDWGQDLCYLTSWIEANQVLLENEPLHLAYFGYFDPADIGYGETLSWPSEPSGDSTELRSSISSGFYAISTNHLYGFPWKVGDGTTRGGSINKSIVQELRNSEPIARAGYSISIYRKK